MMVKCKTAIVAFLCLLGVIVFESCKNEDPVCDVDITSKETVLRMRMNIIKSSFDLNAETRSETATEWKDNDIVYIHFKTDTGTIPAKATFSVAENDWTVRYNGVLPQGNNLSCTATYFEKIDSVSSTTVYISPETAIYCDTVATYTFASGRELEVSATLMPETGRIRFKGESNLKFALVGITNYCRYSIEENKLVKDSKNTIWAEVLADGFTPYYYGMFTDSVAPSLDIVYSGNRYNASMPNTIFRRGESGWMNVPTENNYNSWTKSRRSVENFGDIKLRPTSTNGNWIYHTFTTFALSGDVLSFKWDYQHYNYDSRSEFMVQTDICNIVSTIYSAPIYTSSYNPTTINKSILQSGKLSFSFRAFLVGDPLAGRVWLNIQDANVQPRIDY